MKKFYLFIWLCLLLPPVIYGQNSLIKGVLNSQPQSPKGALNNSNQSPFGGLGHTENQAHKSSKKLSSPALYWNEWINYNLKYYKIKIAHDGIYRIDSLALAKAGINVAASNSNYFKLFYRGQEQYIYVNAQSPTNFSEVKGNYIEFYGQHNDGTLDSLVYSTVPIINSFQQTVIDSFKFLPNPYYSLFNDTSTFYLTYDSSSSGKRMVEQNNTSFGSYTPNPYFFTSTVNQQNTWFAEGAWTVDGGFTITDPRFMQSECWTDKQIATGNGIAYSMNVKNVYTGAGAPNAFIRTVFMGTDISSLTSVSITSSHGPLWTNVNFLDFKATDTSISVPSQNVSGNNYTVTFINNSNSYINSAMAPTYIYVNYPHTMDMFDTTSFDMEVPDGSGTGAMAYLDMTNFMASLSDTVRFYDLTNHYRMVVTNAGGFYKVLIPNSGGLKHCYMTSDSVIQHSYNYSVKNIIPVGHNRNGTFYNFNSVTADSAYLIITHPKLWTSAQNYAAYRSTKYNVVLADINEIYDQFGYGVDYSPIGIRNLCNLAINKWPSPPSNLFLLGKAVHEPLFRAAGATSFDSLILVPSWGYPSSDLLLTNGLGNSTLLEPGIPTGRIAAESDADVTNYLGKVVAYENTPPSLWQKKVVHFAGGSDVVPVAQFENFLNNYASEITGPLFGAEVFTFSKETNSPPIGPTLSDSIMNLINGGVSIMNFFGHSSGNEWDFNLDYPNEYSNTGKYPLIIANACLSGDIFQPTGEVSANSSISEQWVLEKPGSIGFLASDYLGNPGNLNAYNQQLYTDFGSSPYYRQPLGKIIQNTVGAIQGNATGLFQNATCLEMTLHGDPAIMLCQYDSLPDYALTDSSIYFTPSNITTQLDSFTVHVIVSNYGEALNQTVPVLIKRFFPNGAPEKDTTCYLKNIYFQNTINVRFPVDHVNGPGLNSFCAIADYIGGSYANREITYSNNNTVPCTSLNISSGDIIPVWPYDYAIIPNTSWDTLRACTGDPFAPMRTYIFEIDTTDLFNSPWRKSQLVTQSGGVVNALPSGWDSAKHGPVRKSAIINKTGIEAMNIAKANFTTTNIQSSAITHQATVVTNPLPQVNGTATQPSISAAHPAAAIKSSSVAVTNNTLASPAGRNNSLLFPTMKGSLNAHVQSTFNSLPKSSVTGNSNLTLNNGQVYYWRVRRDTGTTPALIKNYPWMESSFQCIKGHAGWGQSEYFQFLDDEISQDAYNIIDTNNKTRQWYFSKSGKQLQCNTFGTEALNIALLGETGYSINNFIGTNYGGCQYWPGIYLAIIDSVTLQPWIPDQHDLGQYDYKINVQQCFDTTGGTFIYWEQYPVSMANIVNALKSIPNGDYILAWSWVEGYFKSPGLVNAHAVVSEFASLGATQMTYHETTPGLDSVPFIFFVQKGHPASAIQVYGRNDTSAIQLNAVLKNPGEYGSLVTPFIGPAAKYDSLSWYQHSLNHGNSDSVRLSIIGQEQSGATKTLLADVTPSAANMYISSIDAAVYPYIQLEMFTKDNVKHTPAQMNWWRVFYTPVPELAVNPNIYTYFHNDSLQLGDTVKFKTVVQNISEYPIDSTVLLSWMIDQHRNQINFHPPNIRTKIKKLSPFGMPNDTAMLSLYWPTSPSYMGNNSVWFEVNPGGLPTTRLEQYHFNNYATENFYVFNYKINPLLDVTFNGVHILNNDIVSATPSILVSVMDENRYLALNQASAVQVYINQIGQPQVPVPYGSSLSFTPAVLPNNKCSVLYTPTLTDGTYQLTIQAQNRVGISSAINNYTIDFQVITKSMISEVLNYPNPFTSSTRFVFTLTGEHIPTTFKIQIITVTGKVVREITENELGPIHIGTNITTYAWDGTDQFGSKLANGVYLYRVITNINGQSIDNYATPADQYFTKGWSKMYIMR